MKVEYAIRLTGSQNIREHWRARSKRVKAERSTAELVCRASLERPTSWPVVIRLTRIGPRKLDSDNVAGSAKATRDGVADFLGVDDGDESKVRWVYAQERGPYGVRVEVQSLQSCNAAIESCARRLSTPRGTLADHSRAPVVAAELDSADPADVATWDEVLP